MRLVSSVLLATGVTLVFTGLTGALGFTPAGVVASLAVVAGLIYVGAIWFAAAPVVAGGRHDPLVIVFDRSQRVVAGARVGAPVATEFPAAVRPEVSRRCGAALAGVSEHFECRDAERTFAFDAAPVRAADGMILYGILMTGASPEAPAPAGAGGATTVR